MSDTLRCCVIDDEPLASGLIASYINKTPLTELAGEFSSPQEAVSLLMGGGVDVVFLDIQMPQLNGMELARLIPEDVRIIFTTAYSEYALEGYRVNALDYLLKPVSYEEFLGAVNRAMRTLRPAAKAAESAPTKARSIIVKSDYKQVQIALDNILFIEGLKDYVKIYCEGAERSILTLMSMKTLEQTLPSPPFMRVHRSFIVNTDKITVIERSRIIFGAHQVPVSDTYRDVFNEFVNSRSIDNV